MKKSAEIPKQSPVAKTLLSRGKHRITEIFIETSFRLWSLWSIICWMASGSPQTESLRYKIALNNKLPSIKEIV